MSRRAEGQLFVGRLAKETRTRDLEDVFEMYGRLSRCEIKYGAEMAYAFVDFEDRRDAEDAQKYENGRDIRGCSIIVEWAKGAPRRPLVGDRNAGYDECYKCHRVGHWARDCPDDRHYGYRRRGRSRSRSRRRRRSRSRSRSKDRRRSRRSLSHSRSKSNDRKRSRRSPRSRSRSRQKSGSKSPRPERKSPSKSPRRSPSHSPKKIGDQQKSDTEYKSSDE